MQADEGYSKGVDPIRSFAPFLPHDSHKIGLGRARATLFNTMAAAAAGAATPLTLGLPVDGLLYTVFESAVKASVRLLVKDIATAVGQPEDPLLKALKANQVRPYIFEEDATEKEPDMRCTYVCQRPDQPAILQPCGQPVYWNAGCARCAEHLYAKATKPQGRLTPVQRIEEIDECRGLFVTGEGMVMNGAGEVVGTYYKESQRLIVFEVEGA